jgi:hypothetical protein
MPTTTNYGWTTPADTDLVKDGAAAIRTLGSSIDTSVKSLNAGTTAGDIDYYTSATAKARVGIGSSGQVLAVSGGVPAWTTVSSGGMTLLSTTTLSGASTTISSISGSYNQLYGIVYGVSNATADGQMRMALNGVTSGVTQFGTNAATTVFTDTNDYLLFAGGGQIITRTNTTNAWSFIIDNYASTASLKPILCYGMFYETTTRRAYLRAGGYESTSAITSLVLSNSGGAWSTGTVLLYGVK